MHRFQDTGQSLYEMMDEFLVRCPRCQHSARVFSLGEKKPALFGPKRLVCANCGYSKNWKKQAVCLGGPVDAYFRQPLWLQTPCCGHTLWAYNERHLNYLEDFIRADLRERIPSTNRSIASRVPVWMKSAHNRNDLLKGIERLRQKLK
jgi:transcription elongation factor Elf1